MDTQITIEDGQNIKAGTTVRILTAPPVLTALIGTEGVVTGNLPNALFVRPVGQPKPLAVLKGWGTKKNPGRLTVAILKTA